MPVNQPNVETPKKGSDRLIMARKSAGYADATAAAVAMGVKPATYLGHENGSRGFTFNAQKYADFFRVNLDWLIAGRGSMKRGSGDNQSPHPDQPPVHQEVTTTNVNPRQWAADLPILGAAACGEDGLFELNGQTHGFLRRPPILYGVPGAYALYVIGESMYPWRENGAEVVVDPHRPPNINDYVVVQLKVAHQGDPIPAYIKKLVRRTAKDLRLLQYKPEEELVIPMSKVATIHRILDWPEIFHQGGG